MKLHTLSSRASARGLTLIELVVVLAILVALAGLIIGNFPSLLKKASGSTSANTIQDIGRALNIRYTTKGSYPDGYDNIAYAMLPLAATTATNIVVIPDYDLAAFNTLGITNVVALLSTVPAGGDATMSVSTLANLGALTITSTLTTLKPLSYAYTNLVPNSAVYDTSGGLTIYLFGIGKFCTLIGGNSTLLEAPTRTGTSEQESSQTYYQRYCVAYVVDGPSVVGSRTARLVGVVAPTSNPNGWDLTDNATATYKKN